MDFNVTGSGAMVNVATRVQLMDGEAYVGGLNGWLQPFTFAFIAHISVTGEYEILYQADGPSMTPDTWVNLRLEVSGEDPVTLADDFQAIDGPVALMKMTFGAVKAAFSP